MKNEKLNGSLNTGHENFKLGQGYASGEKGSDSSEHRSSTQLGDNPLPKSGGGYAKAGNAQPKEDQDESVEVIPVPRKKEDAKHLRGRHHEQR